MYVRSRNCSEPAPQYGGLDCPGNNTQVSPCNFGVECPSKSYVICLEGLFLALNIGHQSCRYC